MTMSREISAASFITKVLVQWSKINSIDLFQQQEMMFEDMGAIADLESNEITSTRLLFMFSFCIPFIISTISSY